MVVLLLAQYDILIDVGMPLMFKNCLYNCRLVFLNGKIIGIRPKISLANDGNYREARWFTAWKRGVVAIFPLPDKIKEITGQSSVPIGDIILRTLDGITIGFESCEELFTPMPSNCYHAVFGTDFILNGSASHHEFMKLQKRVELISAVTKKNGGTYLYSNMMGCDGERLYYDGCPLIISNESFLAQGSQFSLQTVQTITACIDISTTRSYQSCHISRSTQAADFINNGVIDVEFNLGRLNIWKDFENVSRPISIHYYQSEEEIQLGPACWLWDYLRRSNSNGFFLPLSGGIDSCSVALIVYSMCVLVCEEIKQGNDSVLKDIRRICCDEIYIPETPKELCM
jgi:NAD+ synthase (glutamine-hydrolysing)